MGRSSQRKGADGERELKKLLQEAGYETERGGMAFGEVPDLVGLPGVHIEVKRVEKLNLQDAMDQSIRDAEKFHDGVPTVFHRRNRQPWLVTMPMVQWLGFYKAWVDPSTASGPPPLQAGEVLEDET